ncbi:hypothetical protein [Castellaniella caeni]
MKKPASNPNARRVPARLISSLQGVPLDVYTRYAQYKGSSEHKKGIWFGVTPVARVSASVCPKSITLDEATNMLKAAIRAGNISEDLDGGMPKRVWYSSARRCFEARLTGRADQDAGIPASYKGWPIEPGELPTRPRVTRECDEV